MYAHPPDFNPSAYIAFNHAVSDFNHKLAGCPDIKTIHMEECTPSLGKFDIKLWRKIQRLAPKALSLPGDVQSSPVQTIVPSDTSNADKTQHPK